MTLFSSLAMAYNITAVAISTDGATGWTAEGTTVRAWDLVTGAQIAEVVVADATMIRSLSAGANGAVAISGGGNGWLWKPDRSLVVLNDPCALDASGTRLVVLDPAGPTIYDVATMSVIKVVPSTAFYNFMLGFDLSPDGRFLAMGTLIDSKSRIVVYDLEAGTVVGTIKKAPTEGQASLEIAPDGTRLAFAPDAGGNEGEILLYDVASGKRVFRKDAHGAVSDLAWSGGGTRLAVTTADAIRRYDPAGDMTSTYGSFSAGTTYTTLHSLTDSSSTFVSDYLWTAVAITPDGLTTIVGTYGRSGPPTFGVVRDDELIGFTYRP